MANTAAAAEHDPTKLKGHDHKHASSGSNRMLRSKQPKKSREPKASTPATKGVRPHMCYLSSCGTVTVPMGTDVAASPTNFYNARPARFARVVWLSGLGVNSSPTDRTGNMA